MGGVLILRVMLIFACLVNGIVRAVLLKGSCISIAVGQWYWPVEMGSSAGL